MAKRQPVFDLNLMGARDFLLREVSEVKYQKQETTERKGKRNEERKGKEKTMLLVQFYRT